MQQFFPMRTTTPSLEHEIGRILRRLRESKGWTQEELADRCSIHRTYVSQLERGLKSPTVRLLWTLSDCLSIKPHEYLREAEEALEGGDDATL